MMALDQNQEHCTQFLKEEGGPKGLYGQTEEKDIIEISRPGILRAIKQFENQLDGVKSTSCEPVKEHPESSIAEQEKFITPLEKTVKIS